MLRLQPSQITDQLPPYRGGACQPADGTDITGLLGSMQSPRVRSLMKIVLAGYGSRGDVEPCVAVGRELLRRGHDVLMAVSPDKLRFVESAG